MNGSDLLEGLGYIDEALVQKAETAQLRKNSRRPLIAAAGVLAACLALLLAIPFQRFARMEKVSLQMDAASEMQPAMMEAAEEAAGVIETEAPAEAENSTAEVLLPETLTLSVIAWTEDGFLGITLEDSFLPRGTEIRVVLPDNTASRDSRTIPEDTVITVTVTVSDWDGTVLYGRRDHAHYPVTEPRVSGEEPVYCGMTQVYVRYPATEEETPTVAARAITGEKAIGILSILEELRYEEPACDCTAELEITAEDGTVYLLNLTRSFARTEGTQSPLTRQQLQTLADCLE